MLRWFALALLFGLIVPFVSKSEFPLWAREAYWWAIGAVVLFMLVRLEHRPLASIGIKKPGLSSIGLGLLGAVVLVMITYLVALFVLPALGMRFEQGSLTKIAELSLPAQFLLALRAGVVEEIVYRGYIIGRGSEIVGNRLVPALLSVLLFVVAHLGTWSASHLIFVAAAALFLTALYLWRRDLITNIIAHTGADFLLFLGASLAAQAGRQ